MIEGLRTALYHVPDLARARDWYAAVRRFIGAGAAMIAEVQAVGGDIRVACVADPFGNLIGLIETPGFGKTGQGGGGQ